MSDVAVTVSMFERLGGVVVIGALRVEWSH